MWVTYKNGAAPARRMHIRLTSGDRVVAVARGRHLRGSVERPCVAYTVDPGNFTLEWKRRQGQG